MRRRARPRGPWPGSAPTADRLASNPSVAAAPGRAWAGQIWAAPLRPPPATRWPARPPRKSAATGSPTPDAAAAEAVAPAQRAPTAPGGASRPAPEPARATPGLRALWGRSHQLRALGVRIELERSADGGRETGELDGILDAWGAIRSKIHADLAADAGRPMGDHQHAVAHQHCFANRMGDEQHGLAGGLAQPEHFQVQTLTRDSVQ